MVAAPEFLAPATDRSCRWKWLSSPNCKGRRNHLTDSPFKPGDCEKSVIAKTVPPAGCTGSKRDCSPWDTPGRQWLAGGRPQLAAGIRAASYSHECSNLCFPASIQQFGSKPCARALQPQIHKDVAHSMQLRVLSAHRLARKRVPAGGKGCKTPADPRATILMLTEPIHGPFMDSLALCLRHIGGWSTAPRSSLEPGRLAGRPGLRVLQPDRFC